MRCHAALPWLRAGATAFTVSRCEAHVHVAGSSYTCDFRSFDA